MNVRTRNIRAPRGTALTCKGWPTTLNDALDKIGVRKRAGIARSIALEANAAEALPEILHRGVILDIVTDQTSAHDALNGYIPVGMSLAEATSLRTQDPDEYVARSMASTNAFDIPGFVPDYVRPLFCESKGPFRWAALAGDPEDIRITDDDADERLERVLMSHAGSEGSR